MAFRAPIGISDFRMLREENAYYVDKTRFIIDLLTTPTQAVLLPRPRRFGKTLNLSTLRHFVEKSDRDCSALFEGLEVWNSVEVRKHFQRYPVIYLTFKDVKAANWKDAFSAIRGLIAKELGRHRDLLDSGRLRAADAELLARMERQEDDGPLYWNMLRDLSQQLEAFHGDKVFLLIDEYDAPILTAYANGYYDEAVTFFRNFLSAGLKDNTSLARGVLTGVLRVAKESIFSGLNNVDVASILSSDPFTTAFGFTQPEVDKLVQDLGDPHVGEELQRWYNGYLFHGHTIYNPWSVLNYAKRPGEGCRPHWVYTGSEDILRELMLERGHRMDEELETLLAGGAISKVVSEHVVLRELKTEPNAVWSLLLMAGYLTARKVDYREGDLHAELAIPNQEIRYVFRTSVRSWLESGLGGSREVESMLKAMLNGDDRSFGKYLSKLVVKTLSYYDTAGREPERVYQAFLLGLLVQMESTHQVRSNRESGYGRYDVALIPKQAGQPGVVIELKEIDEAEGETTAQALDAALEQIASRGYVAELEAAGASPIQVYGIVFDGKRVSVKQSAQAGG
jgi:hypothetical protein